MDSAASFGIAVTDAPSLRDDSPRLLLFSANHAESLRRTVQSHLRYIEHNPHSVPDLSYTLGARRYHLPNRAYCVTTGPVQPPVSQFVRIAGTPKVIAVFTGQGAQYAQMGRELILQEKSFCEHDSQA